MSSDSDASIPTLTDIVHPGDPVHLQRVRDTRTALQDADREVARRAALQVWLSDYLNGPGRALIEARCRAVLAARMNDLAVQITDDVVRAMHAELASRLHALPDAPPPAPPDAPAVSGPPVL